MNRQALFLVVGLLIGSPARAQSLPASPVQEPHGGAAASECALASPADELAYERVVTEAVREHQEGHWAEARALFLRAHALRPSARTLRTLGMTAFELREYPQAVRELSAALNAARCPLSESHRSQVQELLARAEIFVGAYRVQLAPPDAALRVDGMDVKLEPGGTLLLAVGRHVVEARAAGRVAETRTVIVDGRDEGTLTFSLLPFGELPAPLIVPPPPVAPAPVVVASNGPILTRDRAPPAAGPSVLRSYVWTLGAAGAALAFGASSLGLHMGAKKENERLEALCTPMPCAPSAELTQKRDTLDTWSRVSLGASLAFVAGAAVAYVFEHRARVRRVLRSAARPPRLELARDGSSDCRVPSRH